MAENLNTVPLLKDSKAQSLEQNLNKIEEENEEMRQSKCHNDSNESSPKAKEKDNNSQNRSKLSKNQFNYFFKQVGTKDWYQVQAFAQFSLQALCVSWFLTSIKFYFETPNYICPKDFRDQSPQYQDWTCEQWVCNLTYGKDPKLNNADVERFVAFDSFYSATRQYRLVCSDSYLRNVIIGVSQVFTSLGLIFFSQSSDNYGRKQALQTGWKMFTIGFIIYPFVQVFPLFMIGYCLCSFTCMSAIIVQVTLLNEQTTGRIRQHLVAGLWFMLAFGQLIFVAFSYLVPSWKYLSIITGTIPVLLINWIIKVYFESARFYYPTSKLKALRTLNKIANVNNREQINVDLDQSTWIEEWKVDTKSHFLLFKYPSLRKPTIFGYLFLLGLYFVYYGGEQEILLFQGLQYEFRVFIIVCTKFVGYGIITFYIHKIERVKTIRILTIIGLIILVVYYSLLYQLTKSNSNYEDFVKNWSAMKIIAFICALVGRTISAINIIISFIYFPEIYPTAVRTMGFGTIMTTQQIGFFVVYALYDNFSTYRVYEDYNVRSDVIIVMSVMILSSIVSIISSYFLPETRNVHIQDEIEEIAIAQFDNFTQSQRMTFTRNPSAFKSNKKQH